MTNPLLLNDKVVYTSRNYFRRVMIHWLLIIFFIVMGLINWHAFIIGPPIYYIFKANIITIFTITTERLLIQKPYFFGYERSFAWSEVNVVRVHDGRDTPYGASPFMRVFLKNGDLKTYSFSTMDPDDKEQLIAALVQILGEDKVQTMDTLYSG